MSKDRVRFTIPPNHYINGMRDKQVFARFLYTIWGRTSGEWLALLERFPNGFVVFARPAQFARFIIERNAEGWLNRIRDLKAELVRSRDTVDQLVPSVCRDDVVKVLNALGLTMEEATRMMIERSHEEVVDISRDPAPDRR